jgi:hypothetical protein
MTETYSVVSTVVSKVAAMVLMMAVSKAECLVGNWAASKDDSMVAYLVESTVEKKEHRMAVRKAASMAELWVCHWAV